MMGTELTISKGRGFFLSQLALSGFLILLIAEEAQSLRHKSVKSVSINPEKDFISTLPVLNPQLYKKENSSFLPARRNSRFLSSLLRSNPLNCMPQLMCELANSKEPNESTDTINDYKYLMQEILKPDDDEDVRDVKKQKSKTKSSEKYRKISRRPIKRKDSEEDDSSPEDNSKPSEEQKADGLAELMDMEEADAIEEKALTDLVHEDPADIVYAMADLKKRDKLKTMVKEGKLGQLDSEEQSIEYGYIPGDESSFDRNLNLLGRSLREGRSFVQRVFRKSRILQDKFIKKKQQELDQTQDIFDRVRIAAEVGDFTRSGRQCRALFGTCPANVGTQNIPKGKQKKKTSGMSPSDIKNLVSEIKKAQGYQQQSSSGGGMEVKLVLNIGGNPSNMINPYGTLPQQSEIQSTTISPQRKVLPLPSSTVKSPSPTLLKLKKLETFLHLETEKINKEANLTSNKSMISVPTLTVTKLPLKPPSSPKIQNKKSNTTQINSSYRKSTANSKPTVANSKPTVGTKSNSIKHPNNSFKPKPNQGIKMNVMQDKIQSLIKKIDPKLKKMYAEDSDSLESSEETSEVLTPYRLPSDINTSSNSKPNLPSTFPRQSNYRSQSPPSYTSLHSFVEQAHQFLFSDRQVVPLPVNDMQYIPSAQRHAYQTNYHANHNKRNVVLNRQIPTVSQSQYYLNLPPINNPYDYRMYS